MFFVAILLVITVLLLNARPAPKRVCRWAAPMSVHDIVAAIKAEETVYNTIDDPERQDASCHRLCALQLQMNNTARQARAAGARAFKPTADLLALRERTEASRLRRRRFPGGGVV